MSINYEFNNPDHSTTYTGNDESLAISVQKPLLGRGVYLDFQVIRHNRTIGRLSLIIRDEHLRRFEDDFNNVMVNLHPERNSDSDSIDARFNQLRSKVVATGVVNSRPTSQRESDYLRGIADATNLVAAYVDSLSARIASSVKTVNELLVEG